MSVQGTIWLNSGIKETVRGNYGFKKTVGEVTVASIITMRRVMQWLQVFGDPLLTYLDIEARGCPRSEEFLNRGEVLFGQVVRFPPLDVYDSIFQKGTKYKDEAGE